MTAMNADPDLHSNDLTQLSSREQLSALMDGALPADQTRFLLRRLQHDDSLAGSWERWRMAGESMRGLAPAQRLPADFAARVALALHGDAAGAQPQVAVQAGPRSPAWLRWGGGAAMAASLAVVAALALRPADAPDTAEPAVQVAAATPEAQAPAHHPRTPAPAAPDTIADAPAALVAAAVLAAKPVRERRVPARAPRQEPAAAPMVAQTDAPASATPVGVPLPKDGIVTRPWPRTVLPQYASSGLTVGLGDGNTSASHNPFQPPRLVMVPVVEPAEAPPPPVADADAPANNPAPSPQP